jgi:hypothetical protein
MSDETIQQIKLHRNRVVLQGQDCSLSDAVEHMIALAAKRLADPKLQPATEVLGALPGTIVPEWIQIDVYRGKRVRCAACGESYDVPADRFVSVLKGIARFIEVHDKCGDDEGEGEGGE